VLGVFGVWGVVALGAGVVVMMVLIAFVALRRDTQR